MNSELRRAASRSSTARSAVSFAAADGHARADQGAHHAAAERVGLQPGDEHAVAVALPGERLQLADRRRALARLAERGEVVQAEQRLRGVVHRADVERRGMPERVQAAARVLGGLGVRDAVLVAAPDRGEAGVEAVGANSDDATLISDSSPAMPFSRRARALGPAGPGRPPRSGRFRMRSCASVRSTCATWPVACTPTSVRPATVRRGGSPARRKTVASAASSSPCTVRSPGWLAHPENAVPS